LKDSEKKLERMFGRPEFRHVLSSFWVAASEYTIVPEAPASTLEKIVVKKVQPKKTYLPFQDPDLFVSFTKLVARGKPSNASILNWVDTYGLLRKAKDGEQGRDENMDRALEIRELNQADEPVETFVSEALQALSVLNLYTDLSSGSIDDLRRRIGVLRDKHKRWGLLSNLDTYLVEEWDSEADEVGHSDTRGLGFMASVKLEATLMNKIENVRPTLYSDFGVQSTFGNYKPTPSWECPDLISAIYLQLYLWIVEGLPMRRCAIPSCRTPFPMKRSDKQVCSETCRSNLRHYPELQRRR
jgi:hypothetical protein